MAFWIYPGRFSGGDVNVYHYRVLHCHGQTPGNEHHQAIINRPCYQYYCWFGYRYGINCVAYFVLAAGIYGSYFFAGLYGVAIAAAGMMATTAMQLAIDAFGPIADNAGGIAEMSRLPEEVRGRTDNLDAVGNTTAATGKGFAIASAALTSLALFAAFVGVAGIEHIDIYKANVLAGLFVGGMIPFIFSALCISAVGRAAMAMVEEVRRQFREIPGIMEYKARPEYEKCVEISTKASIREMVAPGPYRFNYAYYHWLRIRPRSFGWFAGRCYRIGCVDGDLPEQRRRCMG
jgi:hypothetical protein